MAGILYLSNSDIPPMLPQWRNTIIGAFNAYHACTLQKYPCRIYNLKSTPDTLFDLSVRGHRGLITARAYMRLYMNGQGR